jgi:hypothetical protein
MDRSEFCEIDRADRRLDIFFDDLLVSFARLSRYVGLGIGNEPAVKKSAQRFFGWFYIRTFIHGSQDTPAFQHLPRASSGTRESNDICVYRSNLCRETEPFFLPGDLCVYNAGRLLGPICIVS